MFLQYQRQPKTVVHVGSLLESTGTLEAIRSVVVGRSSNPSDVVIRVEGDTLFTVLSADQLQTVVVDKDRRGATLTSVALHGLLDGVNR